jgi:outer membrane protein OmpA-like peptidoglycan-associated protein
MTASRLGRWFGGALLLALAACSQVPDNLVVLVEDIDGGVGQVSVSNASGETVLSEAGAAAGIADADEAPEAVALEPDQVDTIFAPAVAARAPDPYSVSLYFEAGTTTLTPDSARDLESAVALIAERPVPDVSIIGHTDTQGDAEANAALGLDRAETVRDAVVAAGVDPALVAVASHGESNPLVPTGDEVDEPRNRRVELIVR